MVSGAFLVCVGPPGTLSVLSKERGSLRVPGMLRMKEFPTPEGSIAGLSFVYLSLTENILIYH